MFLTWSKINGARRKLKVSTMKNLKLLNRVNYLLKDTNVQTQLTKSKSLNFPIVQKVTGWFKDPSVHENYIQQRRSNAGTQTN